nr:hypothetical protein [Tanacetum cinerariifolium]
MVIEVRAKATVLCHPTLAKPRRLGPLGHLFDYVKKPTASNATERVNIMAQASFNSAPPPPSTIWILIPSRSRAVVLSITTTPASPYRHHQAVVPYYGYASATYMATTDFIYNHLDTVAEFQLHEETVLRLNGGGVAYKPSTCGVWRCS